MTFRLRPIQNVSYSRRTIGNEKARERKRTFAIEVDSPPLTRRISSRGCRYLWESLSMVLMQPCQLISAPCYIRKGES